jgi:serine/threonine protein kinase
MSQFISKYDLKVLTIQEIVKSIYKSDLKEKKSKQKAANSLVSYIKNKKFKDFIEKLEQVSIKFNQNDILSHNINIDNIIVPYRYISSGTYGVTFLAKFKEGDNNNFVIVKYEIVTDKDYQYCHEEYNKCLNNNNNESMCKVNDIYCRFESAFDEIYINKMHIQNLNSPNFAMFYAFFMCPTNSVFFEENGKKPAKEFIQKYIDDKKFCLKKTLDAVNQRERMHVFSVYEYIPGTTLYDYIESKEFNIISFYEIILQIFGALAIAQVKDKVFYNHNDLHSKNVMIQSLKNDKQFVFKFPYENTINKVTSNKRAVIIDQGSASLLVKDKNEYKAVFGWYKKKVSKFLKNFNTPYTDIYRILTYSYYVMTKNNKSRNIIQKIKKDINSLFSLNTSSLSTLCTDFIDNEYEIWFENYYLYLKDKLSKNDFSTLMNKIESITYEYAYNYFYYNFN